MFAKSKVSSLLFKNLSKFSTGNLYTWGLYSCGTGSIKSNTMGPEETLKPEKVEFFNKNVSKVAMGLYHTAIVTGDGDLYMLGENRNGQCGIGNRDTHYVAPQLVEFFKNKNKKIYDVMCGKAHTFVIDTDGQIWSFGRGGSNSMWSDWGAMGALGHGLPIDEDLPRSLDYFQDKALKAMSTGNDFAFAVSQEGAVYSWGEASDGSIGDGKLVSQLLPSENEYFKNLKESHGITVKSIKSANRLSMALLSDGCLYSWGHNEFGQAGIRKNLGHTFDDQIYYPTPVCDHNYQGQNIVDFDLGNNTSVILTDQNRVYWSGLEMAYKPIEFQINSDKKIVKCHATMDGFAVISEDGTVFADDGYIGAGKFDYEQGINVIDGSSFQEGGKILEIGGHHGIRFAIVN